MGCLIDGRRKGFRDVVILNRYVCVDEAISSPSKPVQESDAGHLVEATAYDDSDSFGLKFGENKRSTGNGADFIGTGEEILHASEKIRPNRARQRLELEWIIRN